MLWFGYFVVASAPLFRLRMRSYAGAWERGRIVYAMLRYKTEYNPALFEEQEQKLLHKRKKNLIKQAKSLGLTFAMP